MRLIIGLGNPGFRYRKTRHNTGFLAVDYIQKNISGFSKWKLNKNFQAEISKNDDNSVILAKPQTYMNDSGVAAKSLVNYLNLFPERSAIEDSTESKGFCIKSSTSSGNKLNNLLIIHDDFDLPLGEFKIEQSRGSAGHKGVQSIIDALGANDFWRLRIGIRPLSTTENIKAGLPAGIRQLAEKAGDFVLKKFTREEKTIIDKIIPEAVKIFFENFPA